MVLIEPPRRSEDTHDQHVCDETEQSFRLHQATALLIETLLEFLDNANPNVDNCEHLSKKAHVMDDN